MLFIEKNEKTEFVKWSIKAGDGDMDVFVDDICVGFFSRFTGKFLALQLGDSDSDYLTNKGFVLTENDRLQS